MGTKGRDVAVWAFFVLAGVGVITPWTMYLLVPTSLSIVAILYFYLIEKPAAIHYRQVTLLPIYPYWARVLVRGHSLSGKWDKAYEVHIMFNNESLKQQRNYIVADIQDITKNRPGLYLWETHVSVPIPVRKTISEHKQNGSGFWEKGVFLPRPPFMYTTRRLNKPLYHGAVIV